MNQDSLDYLRVRYNIPFFYIGHHDSERNTVTFCGFGQKEYIVLLEEGKVIEIN